MVTTTQSSKSGTKNPNNKAQQSDKLNSKAKRLGELLQRNLLRRKQQQC